MPAKRRFLSKGAIALTVAMAATPMLPTAGFAGEVAGSGRVTLGETLPGDVGLDPTGTNTGSVSIGNGTSLGPINTGASAAGYGGIAIGGAWFDGTPVTGTQCSAASGGLNSIAMGTGAVANTTDCKGGGGVFASGDAGVAVGAYAGASERSTAVGDSSRAEGARSVAIGHDSQATAENAIAVGEQSRSTGIHSIALGLNSEASGLDAVALGNNSEASGIGSSSLGTDSTASGLNSTALGKSATCAKTNGTALGYNATCGADNEIALGTGSNNVKVYGTFESAGAATFKGDVSFTGANPVTFDNGIDVTGDSRFRDDLQVDGDLNVDGDTNLNGPNITVGNPDGSSVVTVPGIARGGGKRFVTVRSDGTLGSTSRTITDYDNALQSIDNQVSSVGAMAAALSAIPTLTTGEKNFACGVGTGAFGSAWAGAVGCVGKVASNVWVNGALSFTPSVSTDFGTTPSVGGRLGVFFQF